jgi:hypothetical protein
LLHIDGDDDVGVASGARYLAIATYYYDVVACLFLSSNIIATTKGIIVNMLLPRYCF